MHMPGHTQKGISFPQHALFQAKSKNLTAGFASATCGCFDCANVFRCWLFR